MNLNAPGLFLCFDDHYIDRWYDYRDFFDSHNMKVTFFISTIAAVLKVENWSGKIRELMARGHTIGCHGLNHIRAGYTVDTIGCEKFLESEIYPWIEIMEKEGIKNIQHYCYPYGNRSEKSDECLLKIFRTVRRGGRSRYTLEEMKRERIIGSGDFGKHDKSQFCGHESFIKGCVQNNLFGNFHMHKPVKHRLEWVSKLKGVNFYPMGALDV